MATDISTLIVKVTSDGAKQTEAELKNLGNQADKTANQTNKLEKGTKQVNSGFKAMKGSTQQVSYQLQDIAVQSQMGTDAFIILGQQGPQLASIFGPGGAVLGVMIAFGAMIGGTLVRAFDDANVGADELEETLDRLSETTKRAENSTFELTKRIIELARANETAARVSMYANIADGTVVIQEQRQAIIDLANESLDFAGFALSARPGRELDDLKG
jgi:chaperonin cofactor prefoldin